MWQLQSWKNRSFWCDLLLSQLYFWGSPLFVRFLHMLPFFNPIIEVATFLLHGCCMLGVFLLQAFSHLGCRQQKHTQHAASMKKECGYLYDWIKKMAAYAKISQTMVNPRNIAGKAEEGHTKPWLHTIWLAPGYGKLH